MLQEYPHSVLQPQTWIHPKGQMKHLVVVPNISHSAWAAGWATGWAKGWAAGWAAGLGAWATGPRQSLGQQNDVHLAICFF
jgi:hypothetical protein